MDSAEKKLISSGLDLKDGKKLGISFEKNASKLNPSFKPAKCLVIKYYDHEGKPLPDWPKSKPFYRIRYLDMPTDFGAVAGKKPVRYTQEPNTAPVAYFPKNQSWKSIISDVNTPLIITEGELKAAKACKEGFPTVGLGGVYNWRSAKLGITWLPSLDCIDWVKRNVYICFDSDYQTNPSVCKALYDFSEELHNKGSFPHIVTLPGLPGLEKVGLDDFLVHAGPKANEIFLELLKDAEPLGLSRPLWEMNRNFVYVRNPGLLVDQRTQYKVSPSAFKEHLQSTTTYQERVLKKDGTISYKPVSAAAAWLKWPLRTEVNKITYSPGKEQFIKRPEPMFNTWPGWGVQPVEGDVRPFFDLIEHIFIGAEDGAKDWFLQWCAYPLQFPGTKLFSSAVIHGIRHGTGKSLIGYTMGRIYGENFAEINQESLHKNSNAWAENRQFIMGDEITGSNKRADADFLKTMITQLEIWIDIKYVPIYKLPDCINYFFTAQHPDSFFLEDDDRRFFIHEVQVGPMPETFYAEYMKWLNNGGAPAIFHYLLNLDLNGFNPAAPAFKTQAKNRMIENVRSDLAVWTRQLRMAPDYILRIGDIRIEKDLFTSKELLQFYDATSRTATTANGLGRELARAGFRQVCEGQPIRLSSGDQARVYAVRNETKWLKEKSPKVIAEHIDAWENKTKKY